ncbi:hypothetical protein AGMMS49960_05250 [Betaproteobacteria bacterium]|nr:hypothetical protein AGMMS49543_05200 [Betaproteobacteria bacterium]GHT99588.1 hypothetical protein AGMMS49960_05250 [Betaproteobacteria bacterium]GHU06515.1 hypothetical protein AGMMS50225_01640 [Betaproteobacteria bacterium]GHU20968.1 hypothetical protein AGMMS50243_17480 [Betaproteobacteria bacterium]
MNTTTTPPLDRPLPKSYMPEEDKIGMSQNAIYLCESVEAKEAGDEEASWAWMAMAKIPEGTKKALVKICGAEFLTARGFDL